MYWKQWGKFRALREGDANTCCFHVRASCRSRRNAIRALQIDGATLVAHDDKVTALTTYYSTIIGGEVDISWEFDLHHLYNGHQRAEQGPLLVPFTDEEARSAARAMCADSAPGPDGVGPGFYAAA